MHLLISSFAGQWLVLVLERVQHHSQTECQHLFTYGKRVQYHLRRRPFERTLKVISDCITFALMPASSMKVRKVECMLDMVCFVAPF